MGQKKKVWRKKKVRRGPKMFKISPTSPKMLERVKGQVKKGLSPPNQKTEKKKILKSSWIWTILSQIRHRTNPTSTLKTLKTRAKSSQIQKTRSTLRTQQTQTLQTE
jgi:hypothetical protein